MKKLFFAILCCAAAARLDGQTSTTDRETPPVGPMLARAPAFARWNTTAKPLSANHLDARTAAPGKGHEVMYEYTKTGAVYLQQCTDGLGRRWTNWASNKIAATIWPGTGTVILQARIDGLAIPDYTKGDFPEVNWVAESNYVKTTMYNGRKCLVFSQTTTVADTSGTSAGPVQASPGGQANRAQPVANPTRPATHQVVQTALIDDDTRLPIYAQDGKASYTFAYLAAPETMLQLPAEVEKEVRQQAKVDSDLSHAVPRAF